LHWWPLELAARGSAPRQMSEEEREDREEGQVQGAGVG
jgi:hypothetical protein